MTDDGFISALEDQCPHLAERIVFFWGEPEFFAFMKGLLTTERDDREGFSLEILEELMFLEAVDDTLHPRDHLPAWVG